MLIQLLLSYGLPLCKQLQKKRIYLKEAVELPNNTIKRLESMRAIAENKFQKLFLLAKVSIVFIFQQKNY